MYGQLAGGPGWLVGEGKTVGFGKSEGPARVGPVGAGGSGRHGMLTCDTGRGVS